MTQTLRMILERPWGPESEVGLHPAHLDGTNQERSLTVIISNAAVHNATQAMPG